MPCPRPQPVHGRLPPTRLPAHVRQRPRPLPGRQGRPERPLILLSGALIPPTQRTTDTLAPPRRWAPVQAARGGGLCGAVAERAGLPPGRRRGPAALSHQPADGGWGWSSVAHPPPHAVPRPCHAWPRHRPVALQFAGQHAPQSVTGGRLAADEAGQPPAHQQLPRHVPAAATGRPAAAHAAAAADAGVLPAPAAATAAATGAAAEAWEEGWRQETQSR
mmetsp:Transcript_17941/g.51029  ORF Transcript_17941/g.51029 Transcript_17941/m.51029 type:complete len:219 (-) Transcript_17941:424-1080(-)